MNLILTLICLIIIACIPNRQISTRKINQNKTIKSITSPNFTVLTPYWSTSISPQTTFLQFDASYQDIFYLKGLDIHNMILANPGQQYCLLNTFTPSVGQIRLRAIPEKKINFATNQIEWFLKIEQNIGSSTCLGTINAISDATALYSFRSSVLNSSISLNSVNIALYSSTSNTIFDTSKVSNLNFSNLTYSILPTSVPVQNNQSTCNTTTCKAQGFDCCLGNACVKDGALVSSSTTDPNILNNPSKYPQYYYWCSQAPSQAVQTTTPVDSNAASQSLLKVKIERYYCQQAALAPSTLCSSVVDPTSTSVPQANLSLNDSFLTNSNAIDSACGVVNPTATPLYKFDITNDSSGAISNVFCVLSNPQTIDPTLVNRTVTVSNRSAPHRFFDKATGLAVDLISPSISQSQEGTAFFYLNDALKQTPQGVQLNINAILGSFNVNLSQAIPAKMVPVSMDQIYTISTVSGNSTLCPACGTSPWYNSFTAFPTTTMGKGLQATSLTTDRRTYKNNQGLGNYEDTQFGRACFLPPTMIAFSHNSGASLQTQRMNRLATQAFLFSNGYQRDWYGFNKGALIGSFDGVTWFAIGTGRRIKATSNKLFLAINAPFADLSSNTSLTVDVTPDNSGLSIVAESDYNPTLALGDPAQNQAGTCRFWHQCNTDTDCITKLGWEYSCTDVANIKTYWPTFDINANEIINSSPNISLVQAVHANLSNGSKRCVYRGNGAICATDYTTFSSDTSIKKAVKCAPNFHCQTTLTTTSSFNDRIVRDITNLSSFIYGQRASILGRPAFYMGGTTNTLATATNVQTNLNANIILNRMPGSTTTIGICRPSKDVTNTIASHAATSTSADSINQIANCNSNDSTVSRTYGCPVIENDSVQTVNIVGDLIGLENLSPAAAVAEQSQQNMCGAMSKNSAGSNFSNIEIASGVTSISTQKVSRNACFRQAGAICHTNLDCVPNALHASEASMKSNADFGGTQAEHNFWQESLICGQGIESIPLFGDINFESYSMSKNRCCRAIGNTLTIYTQDQAGIIDKSGQNTNLNLKLNSKTLTSNPAATATTLDGRYSRFRNLPALTDAAISATTLSTITDQYPIIDATSPKPFQWKSINDSAKKTCCGGGWVRKFSDLTHDWTKNDRLNIDYNNFKCLNYSTSLYKGISPNGVNVANYNLYSSKICENPKAGGCIQQDIPFSANITNPTSITTINHTLSTIGSENIAKSIVNPFFIKLGVEVPFPPTPVPATSYTSSITFPAALQTVDTAPFLNQDLNFIINGANNMKTSFYLPSYINKINIMSVALDYYVVDANNLLQATNPYPVDTLSRNYTNPCPPTLNSAAYCIDQIAGKDVIHVYAISSRAVVNVSDWHFAGVSITFSKTDTSALNPGSDLYYLTKLARFELLGIPQMIYEPIKCNDNSNNNIPGVYTTTPTIFNYDAFLRNSKSLATIYDSTAAASDLANPNSSVMLSDQINLPDVFSSNEFLCCLPLGKNAQNANNCCSNFVENGICKLPTGSDLNVYLNKFVSGDGMQSNFPGGPFTESDFIPATGEPKLNSSVDIKIRAFGTAYCQGGLVTNGAAMGNYQVEPVTSVITNQHVNDPNTPLQTTRFGIVDSVGDLDTTNKSGAKYFFQGYRWNHHFYCGQKN